MTPAEHKFTDEECGSQCWGQGDVRRQALSKWVHEMQLRPPDSKSLAFSLTSCNVTDPLSISSYYSGPHEAQCRGPNSEHLPPGQSEELKAGGCRDGGLANRW